MTTQTPEQIQCHKLSWCWQKSAHISEQTFLLSKNGHQLPLKRRSNKNYDGILCAHTLDVKFVRIALILILPLTLAQLAEAQSASASSVNSTCSVSLELSREEREAFLKFNALLSHVDRYYGDDDFDRRLGQTLMGVSPEKKVIELSPLFMEKTLLLIEQKNLMNSIEKTIGLNSPQWQKFFRVMRSVTLHVNTPHTIGNRKLFAKDTEVLMEDIKMLPFYKFKNRFETEDQFEVEKARAVAQIATMYMAVERMSVINKEIILLRGQAASQALKFNMIRIGAAGIAIAGTVYAGPIVMAAGTLGASLTTDVIVAIHLAKLGQILGGAALGAVGGATIQLTLDTSAALMEANRLSKNNRTNHACEIEKQFNVWKSQGASPYLNSALFGAALGLGGGVITLSKWGAKVILMGLTFGVAVPTLYSIGELNKLSIESLAEYRKALDTMEKGDRQQALTHLKNSRQLAQDAGEKRLETIFLAVLAAAVGTSFKSAFINGEHEIRALYANSADTLPQAALTLQDAAKAYTN